MYVFHVCQRTSPLNSLLVPVQFVVVSESMTSKPRLYLKDISFG